MTDFKKIKGRILMLGWYQLIGGIIGIILLILLWIRILNLDTAIQGPMIVPLLVFLHFGLSIYAGYSCIKNQTNKFLVSKINQALQVVSFSIAGTTYSYSSGVYFSIGIDTTLDSILDFTLGTSAFQFQLNAGSDNYIVYINLVAFYLLHKIMKYESILEDENEDLAGDESYLDDHFFSGE